MIRKLCLEHMGYYDEIMCRLQDYELWLRLLAKYKLTDLPQFLYSLRMHPNNIESAFKAEKIEFANKAKEKKGMVTFSLAICVLFFEKARQTIECVQSFLPSGIPIYLLNNGSSVSSFNKVKNFCKPHRQVTIFDAGKNLGVSVGRNYLIEHTTEDWLFFVDNDITVSTKNWLGILLNMICESTDIDAFIPNVFNVHLNGYQTHPSISTHGVNAFFDKNSADIKNIFPGGASIVSREVFSKWGLYDDKMFVGFEDFEFALRAILAGKPLKVKCIQGIELIHSHLFAKNKKEKEAIRTRYHFESLEKSYNRIVEKHGVYLPDNWKTWTQKQIEVTTHRQLLKKLSSKVICFVCGIRNILLPRFK